MLDYIARHILIYARAYGRVRKNLDREFVYYLRSWPSDCDANFHVNTSRYLVYMELARFDLSLKTGLMKYCVQNKVALLVMGAKITYRREIKPLQKFGVHTRILAYDERFVYFDQKITSETGFHAQGYLRTSFYQNGAFVDPKKILDDLELSFENRPLPENMKLWVAMEDGILKDIKNYKPENS